MRITRRTTYAVRCLVYLKDHPGKVIQNERIAADTEIPAPRLSKILADLTRHGFTESVRGKGGGVRLARDPEKISMYEIALSASGGKSVLKTEICEGRGRCVINKSCRLRKVWKDLGQVIDMQLRRRMLSQL